MNEQRKDFYFAVDNPAEAERQRLGFLESIYDGRTRSVLDRLGSLDGWSVLELGVGAGSVARELARRVGPTGRVLGVDINLSHVGEVEAPLEVEQRDLRAKYDFGVEAFDLVHTRAVLAYLPERDAILAAVALAVRPGGALVVEEPVFEPPQSPELLDDTRAKLRSATSRLLEIAGTEVHCGVRMPTALRRLGLDVEFAEGFVPMGDASSAVARFSYSTLLAAMPAFEKFDLFSASDRETVAEFWRTTDIVATGIPVVSTIARKPR